ncbi:dihydroneopterin aldolase [Idiomarina tyrosinivorans]|uniref:7,8-dihydroneopterin aldolase n=2 Tax=Idiomarina tyrosinivorans TaxID=1445662 RepID=A0A432ZJR9_9GAMM|nr:dihydroneopterin aldolase [Idiomarina tyrosinivorans]
MESKMTDCVIIEDLAIDTIIGVFDWEKTQQQRLYVTLHMGWDNSIPGNSDDIADALDYDAVSRHVSAWVSGQPRELIEQVAEGIATELHQQFAVLWVKVKVAKPGAVAQAKNIAVEIYRDFAATGK